MPVEGCDRRRWPGLQRVVRDFQRGPSEQAPAKRHSALGRLTALTCRDASLARPLTANSGEKTSLRLGFGLFSLPLLFKCSNFRSKAICKAVECIEVFSADWWPTALSVLKSAGQQPVGPVAA